MFYYTTRALIIGPIPAVLAWAKAVADHVAKISGVEVSTSVRIGGHNEIVWASRYASMAELEALTDKMQADAGYQALVDDALAKGYFDLPTVQTGIWRSL